MERKLTKSWTDRKIAGVCGGIAEHFNVDSTYVRLAWAASVLIFGAGFWVYVIAAIIIPKDPIEYEK